MNKYEIYYQGVLIGTIAGNALCANSANGFFPYALYADNTLVAVIPKDYLILFVSYEKTS